MKAAKERRERLFREGKPNIRAVVPDDIRWLWAAARRGGFNGSSEEFTEQIQTLFDGADRYFMLEDRNREFSAGRGPVGVVLANYDGWALVPHVEWFSWATPRNIIRCSVGFLQMMRYTRGVGIIRIYSNDENASWFRRLKRYVPIAKAGSIPNGKPNGDEHIFYLRGRGQNGRHNADSVRRERNAGRAGDNPAVAGSEDSGQYGRRVSPEGSPKIH